MTRKIIEETLETKRLCTIQRENESARFFVSFLRQHPEYTENDIQIKISADGFTGRENKIIYYAIIYRTREENDDEFNKRLTKLEDDIVNKFNDCFFKSLYTMMDNTVISNLPDESKERILNRFDKESKNMIKKLFDNSLDKEDVDIMHVRNSFELFNDNNQHQHFDLFNA